MRNISHLCVFTLYLSSNNRLAPFIYARQVYMSSCMPLILCSLVDRISDILTVTIWCSSSSKRNLRGVKSPSVEHDDISCMGIFNVVSIIRGTPFVKCYLNYNRTNVRSKEGIPDMKRNICVTLQYDGTGYSGWQRQGNTGNTIENKLATCLNRMTDNKQNIEVHGSGRTDAGVHAMGQTANFHIDSEKTPDEIMGYLNQYLPEDIRILSASYVDDRFHARLSATGKTYLYRIDNSEKADVFMRKYSYHHAEKLDIVLMREVAEAFVGKHDFMSFSDMKNAKKSTIRMINSVDITRECGIINIEFDGNGFLYHMVRKMTAALIEAGAGRMNVDDMLGVMEQRNRQAFKLIAPAKGLTLKEVRY